MTGCETRRRIRREREDRHERDERGPRADRSDAGAASEWIRAHGGCLWLTEAKKGAAGSEMPRGGASGL